MVINKKQLSKTDSLPDDEKKAASKNKSKINQEAQSLDDSRSSKFTVENPDLSKEYSQAQEKSGLNFDEARQAVLDLIKSKRQSNQEQNHRGILHLNKVFKAKLKPAVERPAEAQVPELPKMVTVSDIKTKLKSLAKKKDYTTETIKKVKNDKRLRPDRVSELKVGITALIILIFVGFFIAVSGIYLGRWQGLWVIKFTQIFPLPAAYVNGQQIKANTYLKDAAVLEAYSKRQNLPVSMSEIRRQTLDKLVEFKIIQQLAEKNNLFLSEAKIQLELTSVLEDQKDEQVNLLTQELYGWTFDQYLEKVLKPLWLRNKVEENFYSSDGGNHIKETINGLYGLIMENESRFPEIAGQVNQDESYAVNGDLGWLKLGEVFPEFELQLLDLKPGEISPVVETRYGYHIIKLEEKMFDADGQPIFHVSHVYLKRPSFADYLTEQIKKATIVTLIRI